MLTFIPISDVEGSGVGLLIWLLEDGAQRPPSYFNLQNVFTPLSRSTFGRLPKQERGNGLVKHA